LVGIFLEDVTADGTALIDDEAVIILCCMNSDGVYQWMLHTHNHRDLAERVLRHVLRCFVLLGVHIDGDVFIGNVLLHEGKSNDRRPSAYVRVCIKFENQVDKFRGARIWLGYGWLYGRKYLRRFR
jgi:hypothetical protein